MLTETLYLLAPEIVLVAVAVSMYMGGAFVALHRVWRWIALGGVVVAGACLAVWPGGTDSVVPLQMDPLADYVRLLTLLLGGLLVLLAWRTLAGAQTPEYLGSLLLVLAGVMLTATANDLVLLFLGLELVSIPTYILLYLDRRDAASQEAAAKYLYLSILASAALLYGFSFLYGASGSMELRQIHARLMEPPDGPEGFLLFAKIALVLVFVGLGFKIAAVPFHFYAPDVYQGTTHANAALLSVAPKIAGLVALVRVVGVALAGVHSAAWPIAMVLAALTMTLGNVLALWQNKLRRLLAYSSIAHAGYMLIGLSVWMAARSGAEGQWNGLGALLFYLATYAVATIGTFAGLAYLGGERGEIEDVEELAGLAWTGGPIRPVLAWAIALFMLSLAGIPPLFGFWGKLAIFGSSLSVGGLESHVGPWFVALAVIGVVNSAIAAAYYLRIVGVMFFRLPLGTPQTKTDAGGILSAALGCAALVLLLGLLPGPWLGQADSAARPATNSEVGIRTSVVGIANSDFRLPNSHPLNPEP